MREQLKGFPVPPKRMFEWERQERRYRVWQYDECVIGDVPFFIERAVSRVGEDGDDARET